MCYNITKKLLFIGTTPFPYGLAATNRLVSLISELPKCGWDVTIICLSSTKYPTRIDEIKRNYDRNGIFRNVKFQYLSLFVHANRYKIIRIISAFVGWINLPFYLLRFKTNAAKGIILTDMTQVYSILYMRVLSIFLKYPLVLLRSEYPSTVRNSGISSKVYKLIFEKWIFKYFDGFLIMTNSLMNYFENLKSDKAKTMLIPMTVDLHRFSKKEIPPLPYDYIVYAGSLSFSKDGVDILIKAFNIIAQEFTDIRLVIIGDISNKQHFKQIQKLINNFTKSVQERIFFTGKIDSNKIPTFLCNAKIMALARPDSIQAQGGFPTKLGEYLATGNPVVVTSVGEIPLYLEHKKNAFLSNPGDVIDFATNLCWVLKHYDSAKKIGNEGRKLVEKVFNPVLQAKLMSDFLCKI